MKEQCRGDGPCCLNPSERHAGPVRLNVRVGCRITHIQSTTGDVRCVAHTDFHSGCVPKFVNCRSRSIVPPRIDSTILLSEGVSWKTQHKTCMGGNLTATRRVDVANSRLRVTPRVHSLISRPVRISRHPSRSQSPRCSYSMVLSLRHT